MRVDNAVIMAAGTSSRFAPLSFERHKGLTVVRGEVLVERQIRQLRDAGVNEIYIVTGYKADQFTYIRDEFGVRLINNPTYLTHNNNASIWAARDVLGNTYICSADNYFVDNPFEKNVADAYYAVEYAEGPTDEWCVAEDESGYICSVEIGGRDSWYMFGHTFWDAKFSDRFLSILAEVRKSPDTASKLWEEIYMEHLDVLKMRMKKYPKGVINEFDTLDELRSFDSTYVSDSRSPVIRSIASRIGARESEMTGFKPLRGTTAEAEGFEFACRGKAYTYRYESGALC